MATVDDGTLALAKEAQDLLFRSARTANAFTGEPVTDDQVRAIYDLVKWGPTAMNNQPMRLVLVRSPEARERLVAHMTDNNKAKTAAAPLTAIVAADSGFHEHFPTTFPHKPDAREAFEDHPGRPQIARFNASIQLGYLILGIRAAGLAAGPMAGYDADGVAREFLNDGEQAVAVVNIGRPDPAGTFPRLPRLDYDQVVTTV
ncbi:malonic semialdehyde reductase [Spirillospora sp. NPDC047279]|uniref:malonic semialdehyde reductase n=1 Tax=Spirillospora sp. NPDC047279 TaxID=3155478 RepID=UPI003411AAB6